MEDMSDGVSEDQSGLSPLHLNVACRAVWRIQVVKCALNFIDHSCTLTAPYRIAARNMTQPCRPGQYKSEAKASAGFPHPLSTFLSRAVSQSTCFKMAMI
jgi:hypothetical protein